MSDLKPWLKAQQKLVDADLKRQLPRENVRPATIHKAMHYSIFAGGKRLRPILCLVAAEACGGKIENALSPACAVEIMHTYSLVHDDLPCMDDDDLRRGRPTSHKVYGEGVAVLCGDALLTEAFSIIAQTPATKRYTAKEYVSELAITGGSKKLIGGQILDLEGEGKSLGRRMGKRGLDQKNRHDFYVYFFRLLRLLEVYNQLCHSWPIWKNGSDILN